MACLLLTLLLDTVYQLGKTSLCSNNKQTTATKTLVYNPSGYRKKDLFIDCAKCISQVGWELC